MKTLFKASQRLPTFCTLAALLWLTPLAAQAEDYTYTTNNGTITITRYIGTNVVVDIPNAINSLPVTTIGYDAFNGLTSLKSVTIPDSVTIIGAYAFPYCTGLTNVTIGNNVTIIDYVAFESCTSLTTINIPSSVTNIGYSAFYNCTSLTTIDIPSSVTSIGPAAFTSCGSLTAINVDPANPAYASSAGVLFDKAQTTLIQCPATKAGAYTIPGTVATVVYEAFHNCTSLITIDIPSSVTNIGGTPPFWYCASLTAMNVDPANPAYASSAGVLFDKGQTTLIQWPPSKAGAYTIPGGVTTIGEGAFDRCKSLTSVNIPNGVTTIGDLAFQWCTNLTNLTIGNSVTTIGDRAFYFCTSLTSVTIPNSVTTIGDRAFSYCRSLTAINVDPANPAYASLAGVLFDKAQTTLIQCPPTKAGAYTVPAGVTAIGYEAFDPCSSLTSIDIPSTVTNIGDYAFYNCTKLTRVQFAGSSPALGGDWVFANTSPFCIIYYLPGISGWGTYYGGHPTAPWFLPYPIILTIPSYFGIQSNEFGFRISWATNASVAIETSTALAGGAWSPIATNPLVDGWTYFGDPNWTNYPTRFYRVRWP